MGHGHGAAERGYRLAPEGLDLAECRRHPLEPFEQGIGQALAFAGQIKRPVATQEQGYAELFLQHLYLLGDRARRDVQFVCRLGKAEMACCCLEGRQRNHGRQAVESTGHIAAPKPFSPAVWLKPKGASSTLTISPVCVSMCNCRLPCEDGSTHSYRN